MSVQKIQMVNGIPVPVAQVLEKIDFDKIREQSESDPHHMLLNLGFSQKEAFILDLNRNRDQVYKALFAGATKEQIEKIAKGI